MFEVDFVESRATVGCASHRVFAERVDVKDARRGVVGRYRRGGLLRAVLARLQPDAVSPLVTTLTRQLEAFGRTIRGGDGEPLATAAEGLAVMRVLDAVRRCRHRRSLVLHRGPGEPSMIAILQFDAVNLPIFHGLLEQGRLGATAALRERGQWYALDSALPYLEGTTHPSLYSGLRPERHGLYFPFMWSASEQRVKPDRDFPGAEPVWDRIGRFGRRSLIVDPYEARRPNSMLGLGLGGWQFHHKITLHPWSVPAGVDRALRRRFGRPPLVEEIYGRPSGSNLSRMRRRLLAPPLAAPPTWQLMP